MELQLTLFVLSSVLLCLAFTRVAPDVILMGALAVLLVFGVLSPNEALAGFANPGVMTIATLYVVAAGLRETGAIAWLANFLLGQPKSLAKAQFRLLPPVAALSAFMNNTAVVAMFIPAVQDWARRLKFPASKLLLPLSYAAIMGGTCTLIGTSTNLVVDGLLQSEKQQSLGMFELAKLGLPLVVVGGTFLLVFAKWLLPNRQGTLEQIENAREYRVEATVNVNGPLAGKSIAQAGLRHLNHGYLSDIERDGRLMTAVAPETVLEAGDVLIFIGAPETARELMQVRGLLMAEGDAQKLGVDHHQRCLVEVVLSPDFAGIGKNVREGKFRSLYQAVILSVSRRGQRINGKVGDITLQVGDTLLLEAGNEFVSQFRYRKDFLLVSPLTDSAPPNFSKAPWALLVLVAMVLTSASGLLSILEAAMLSAGAMLVTGCITIGKARRYVDLSVLLVIAASFSLGVAMNKTGAADWLASGLFLIDDASPWLMLALVYGLTVLLTEMITNNAAAVLMFPIAVAVANFLGVDFMPFVIAVMFAASASFITPLGYQTNLMVMGPGGYRFSDYVRLGLPLSLVVGTTSVLLIPVIWPFG